MKAKKKTKKPEETPKVDTRKNPPRTLSGYSFGDPVGGQPGSVMGDLDRMMNPFTESDER